MIANALDLLVAHVPEVALTIVISSVAVAMHLYGRHLERRTRERSRSRL